MIEDFGVCYSILSQERSSGTPQTFSSAKASSCCLAFATSSAGPRMVTLSFPEPSVGKWMCTPPHSSMIDRTKRPFDPIKELCNFDGMDTSTSVIFAWMSKKKSNLNQSANVNVCKKTKKKTKKTANRDLISHMHNRTSSF